MWLFFKERKMTLLHKLVFLDMGIFFYRKGKKCESWADLVRFYSTLQCLNTSYELATIQNECGILDTYISFLTNLSWILLFKFASKLLLFHHFFLQIFGLPPPHIIEEAQRRRLFFGKNLI